VYLLAIDQGTSSTRALLIDELGEIKAISQKPFKQIYPKSGWVEHDPLEILNTVNEVINEIIEKSSINISDIYAIGITNQRETTVAWSKKTGEPLYNAIVWQCRRTTRRCEELKELGYSQIIKEKTGLPVDPYFSATKIEWLLKNVDTVRQAFEEGDLIVGNIDSFLIYNLTKEHNHFTDVSNASRTMLFNLKTLKWDEELLEIFGIRKEILPEIKESIDDFGTSKFGPPIYSVLGDQQAALFGQMCFEEGMVKSTYGTGAFVLANTGEKIISSKDLITTVGWKLNDKVTYALEGSIFNCGTLVEWAKQIGLVENAAQTEALARSIKDSGNVYFVGAFTGLGAPHWDPKARALFIGMTRDTGRAHLVRAILESIAYSVTEVIDIMIDECDLKIKELRVDGGVSKNDFVMQLQANLLDVKVSRPKNMESTALGAAVSAGIKAGIWSLEDLKRLRKVDKDFHPITDESLIAKYMKWKKAVERSKNWQ